MAKPILGKINCKQVPYSPALRRLVERKIGQWLEKRFLGAVPTEPTFEVTFKRNSTQAQFRCNAVIRWKDGYWCGDGSNDSPSEAFLKSLSNLRPDPKQEQVYA
jgi:hypothetical protein